MICSQRYVKKYSDKIGKILFLAQFYLKVGNYFSKITNNRKTFLPFKKSIVKLYNFYRFQHSLVKVFQLIFEPQSFYHLQKMFKKTNL